MQESIRKFTKFSLVKTNDSEISQCQHFPKSPISPSCPSIICLTSDRGCCLESLLGGGWAGPGGPGGCWAVTGLFPFRCLDLLCLHSHINHRQPANIRHHHRASVSRETITGQEMHFCEHFKIIKVLTCFESYL